MAAHDLTVLLVSKNAAQTIARSLNSALNAGAQKFVLVDSSTFEETVQIAEKTVGNKATIEVHHASPDLTIGAARQKALELSSTPYSLWLDADDAITPDHIMRYHAALVEGAAYVISGMQLLHAHSYAHRQTVEIEGALKGADIPFWCFERNWYPSLHAGVKTEWARAIGFDGELKGAEDHSFFLRALHSGAPMTCLDGASYLYSETPGSLSRDLDGRAADGAITARHWLAKVGFRAFLESKLGSDAALYVLLCLASQAQDWVAFDAYAEQFKGVVSNPANGHPIYDEPIKTLGDFVIGTARLTRGEGDFSSLLTAASESDNPAFLNNAAVALSQEKDSLQKAIQLFERALEKMPHYGDARTNLERVKEGDVDALKITRLPIRPIAFRDRY